MAEMTTPRRRSARLRVEVVRSAEAMDFRAWARQYVEAVLALEGYAVPTQYPAEAATA